MNETFSSRLVKAMNLRNMKATDLSEKSGVDKGSISHYMKGDYKAKDVTLNKLAEVLGVDEAWLMGYDVPMTRSVEESTITDDDLKFALFGGDKNITDEQLDDVKRFAKFIKESGNID